MTEIGMALSNPLKGERRPGIIRASFAQVLFNQNCFFFYNTLGHVGLPLPGVRVRIAEFKTSSDGTRVYYDILAEGNAKATKVEPGKVTTFSILY